MTEQELRDIFESKRKGDDFSTVLLCGQKAYWNKTVQRDWEMFKDGYKLAQETIEQQKKDYANMHDVACTILKKKYPDSYKSVLKSMLIENIGLNGMVKEIEKACSEGSK